MCFFLSFRKKIKDKKEKYVKEKVQRVSVVGEKNEPTKKKPRRGEVRLEILPAVCQGGEKVCVVRRAPTGSLADWKSEEEMEERCTAAKRASPPRRSLG